MKTVKNITNLFNFIECTFIIMDKELYEQSLLDGATVIPAMVGDINLFITKEETEERLCKDRKNLNIQSDNDITDEYIWNGELNVMIGEKDYRRRGYALESIQLMMSFAKGQLNISKIIAKISMKNEPSIKLFEGKLKFTRDSVSEIFQEITFVKNL